MHRNLQLLSLFKRALLEDQIVALLPTSAHGLQAIRGYAGMYFLFNSSRITLGILYFPLSIGLLIYF